MKGEAFHSPDQGNRSWQVSLREAPAQRKVGDLKSIKKMERKGTRVKSGGKRFQVSCVLRAGQPWGVCAIRAGGWQWERSSGPFTWDQAARSNSAPPITCCWSTSWERAFQLGSKASMYRIFRGDEWASLGIAFSVFCSPSFSVPSLSGLWPW